MKRQILIVEDERTILDYIMRGLKKVPNLEVIGCSSVDEALVKVGESVPNLLLTDIQMPGRTGLDLIYEIHQLSKPVPVVVMTGYRASYAGQLSKFSGLTVLEKPFSLEHLRQVIQDKLREPTSHSDLGPFQLMDYLQLAAMGKHSLVIHVYLMNGQQGYFEIYEGTLCNAQLGSVQGEEAFTTILSNPTQSLSYSKLQEVPEHRTISRSLEGLLLDFARIQDEAIRDNASPSTADPLGLGQESNLQDEDDELEFWIVGDDDVPVALPTTEEELPAQSQGSISPVIPSNNHSPAPFFNALIQGDLDSISSLKQQGHLPTGLTDRPNVLWTRVLPS